MIKSILGKEYFCVEVELTTARFKGETKLLKSESIRANKIAEENGYNVKTRQRFSDNGKEYYTYLI